ncbi:hypothetical protein H257_14804 [Aphanomyces astaci]|uniref:Uncharacterized protein n=1 Tax=Aphanomyces astaci TaxID=112090 RepID=W4FSI2_APHAT|nr:hypothetical protein H257_14804 [Aphanomyces astaci]ETV69568.1 hypothetical protein H257_14804 [Aphanomyces astaci]|eukprot:XP_009840992.1 hypothetical protein H257_14804 [Aphanomyces astaci]
MTLALPRYRPSLLQLLPNGALLPQVSLITLYADIGRQPSVKLPFPSRISGYDHLFRVLIDCGASEKYARRSIQLNHGIIAALHRACKGG